MVSMIELGSAYFWGNPLREWIFFGIIFIGSFAILKILQKVVIARLKYLAKKTETDIDDLIIEILEKVISKPFCFMVSLFSGLKYIKISAFADKIINLVFLVIIVYYLTKIVDLLLHYATKKYAEKKSGKPSGISKILVILSNTIIWIIAFLVILQNFGINVTSLIAGLGIGGIAIAFALQNVLADIFASISIYFDKPFEEGDYIVVGTDSGNVTRVGIKSTRIKTLEGQELVISNKQLTESRINNYKKMDKRRVVNTINIEVNTPLEKVKKINTIIKKIFEKEKNVTLDRIHFKAYGNYSLVYELVFFVNSQDYAEYMDAQERVNLDILDAFGKEGIKFAFPTQKVLMEK